MHFRQLILQSTEEPLSSIFQAWKSCLIIQFDKDVYFWIRGRRKKLLSILNWFLVLFSYF